MPKFRKTTKHGQCTYLYSMYNKRVIVHGRSLTVLKNLNTNALCVADRDWVIDQEGKKPASAISFSDVQKAVSRHKYVWKAMRDELLNTFMPNIITQPQFLSISSLKSFCFESLGLDITTNNLCYGCAVHEKITGTQPSVYSPDGYNHGCCGCMFDIAYNKTITCLNGKYDHLIQKYKTFREVLEKNRNYHCPNNKQKQYMHSLKKTIVNIIQDIINFPLKEIYRGEDVPK